MDELTPKQEAIQTIVSALENLDVQFREAMTKAEYKAGGAQELPAEMLVSMLKLSDRIKRLQGETRNFLPAEMKKKKEKHMKSWDERARDILHRV
jgi:hypothetical protein